MISEGKLDSPVLFCTSSHWTIEFDQKDNEVLTLLKTIDRSSYHLCKLLTKPLRSLFGIWTTVSTDNVESVALRCSVDFPP